jgi:hypothetical protein
VCAGILAGDEVFEEWEGGHSVERIAARMQEDFGFQGLIS